jgi:hypothetical protein
MSSMRPASAPGRDGPPAMAGAAQRHRSQWLTASLLAVAIAAPIACGPRIEEDPPIPAHRLEPCESWCSMMFDPVCPATEVEVPTEEECIEGCSTNELLWGTVDDEDECAPTYLPYVECLASLPCGELQQHFDRDIHVPPVEWSSCGGFAQAQLDCQAAHY